MFFLARKLRHVVESPETPQSHGCKMMLCCHFREVSLRAPGKSLLWVSDKNMTSRAFPGRSFLEIGVGAKENIPLVFYGLSQGMGKCYM